MRFFVGNPSTGGYGLTLTAAQHDGLLQQQL
jgi:hypothetical protein